MKKYALDCLNAGISVIPCKKGDKTPALAWKKYQSELASVDDVERWFSDGNSHGLGIVCGKVSGNFIAIDIDMKNDKVGKLDFDFFTLLLAWKPELFDNAPLIKTPSGGWHLYLRCEEEVGKNEKLAVNLDGEVLIETRGEGGYVLTYPSVGYELHGNEAFQVQTIPKSDLEMLLNIARSFTQEKTSEYTKTSSAKSVATSETTGNEDSIFQDFDKKQTIADVVDILARNGWTVLFEKLGVVHLVRPNKAERATSATVGFQSSAIQDNSVRTYVFTTSTNLRSCANLKPSEVLCTLEFNGNWREFAKHLQKMGYKGRKMQSKFKPEFFPENFDDVFNFALWNGEHGDGLLYALLRQGKYCYDSTVKAWYVFSDHWKEDYANTIEMDVPALMKSIYNDKALELVDAQNAVINSINSTEFTQNDNAENEIQAIERQLKAIKAKLKSFDKLSSVRNVIQFAQSAHYPSFPNIKPLTIEGNEWDANPYVLGVKNGVVDLLAQEFRIARPTDYVRKVAPTEWQGFDVPCVRFELFLREIFGETNGKTEISNWVKKLLGYSISGSTDEHVYPIFWGAEGRNGKDTLLETIGYVLGSQLAHAVSKDVVVQARQRSNGQAQPELFDLWGTRIAWVSETDEADKLNAAQMKLLTGGGAISCRPLFGKMTTFTPTHTLILITNHKPNAPADDAALWNRIVLVPFTERFVDNPEKPNEHPIDKQLKEKLREEASGILALLVREFARWKSEGLAIPYDLKIATQSYRTEEDIFNEWFESVLEPVTNDAFDTGIPVGELHLNYKNFCRLAGSRKLMRTQDFSNKLRTVGKVESGYNNKRLFFGFKYQLNTVFEPEQSLAF